jgi:N-acetylglucosaminyldiphosphoundecaprenol N-acetyl-beta-D-mannosaminyltransferase
VEARSNAAYRALLNGGDLNLPDGMPVAWAARLQGRPARRLAGSDAMRLTAAWGIERGLGHYLFGTTEPTLERLRAGLERAHPGISIVGTESPPFRPQSDEELRASVERMRAAGADVVWVGLGAPKQDVVGERLRALDAAPVIMCVGAAFDFVSGVKRRAPRWLQRLGLEWAFRLAAEPRRLWRRYLIGNVRFVAGILADRAAAGRAGLGGGDEAR